MSLNRWTKKLQHHQNTKVLSWMRFNKRIDELQQKEDIEFLNNLINILAGGNKKIFVKRVLTSLLPTLTQSEMTEIEDTLENTRLGNPPPFSKFEPLVCQGVALQMMGYLDKSSISSVSSVSKYFYFLSRQESFLFETYEKNSDPEKMFVVNTCGQDFDQAHKHDFPVRTRVAKWNPLRKNMFLNGNWFLRCKYLSIDVEFLDRLPLPAFLDKRQNQTDPWVSEFKITSGPGKSGMWNQMIEIFSQTLDDFHKLTEIRFIKKIKDLRIECGSSNSSIQRLIPAFRCNFKRLTLNGDIVLNSEMLPQLFHEKLQCLDLVHSCINMDKLGGHYSMNQTKILYLGFADTYMESFSANFDTSSVQKLRLMKPVWSVVSWDLLKKEFRKGYQNTKKIHFRVADSDKLVGVAQFLFCLWAARNSLRSREMCIILDVTVDLDDWMGEDRTDHCPRQIESDDIEVDSDEHDQWWNTYETVDLDETDKVKCCLDEFAKVYQAFWSELEDCSCEDSEYERCFKFGLVG